MGLRDLKIGLQIVYIIKCKESPNMMQQQSNQLCILFRISNTYICFYLLQLTLTISYLITYHLNMLDIASWVQIVIALLILIDLSIRFLSEGHKFWINRFNLLDGLIFGAVVGSVWVSCQHQDIIDYDFGNIFGAIVVALRYSIQIYRLLMLVKVSKELHEQKKYHGMINLGASGELEHDVTDAAEVVA